MLLYAVVIGLVLVALGFDFINGFHDAANSIATVVSTRVLTPMKAVVWAAFFNFIAGLPIFFGYEPAVANTMGKGIIHFEDLRALGDTMVLVVIFSALASLPGAISPFSSTRAVCFLPPDMSPLPRQSYTDSRMKVM